MNAAVITRLRSNRLDFNEQALFDIFSMLTDIEEAFRA